MNYRHALHAGNHADVFKHLTLSGLLTLIARKDAPLAYLDSHAGVGPCNPAGNLASRTGEWLQGMHACGRPSRRLPLSTATHGRG